MKTNFKFFLMGSIVLFGLLASALLSADGPRNFAGPVVSWDRIEGSIVMPDETAMQVGPYFAGTRRFRVGGEGRVTLYTASGYLVFQIKGLSWGAHYNNFPLGSGLNGTFVGTIVCDSTPETTATYQSVDTPTFQLNQGSAFFFGMVALPQICKDEPDKIVFLLRYDPALPSPVIAGKFVAYGAGRVIR